MANPEAIEPCSDAAAKVAAAQLDNKDLTPVQKVIVECLASPNFQKFIRKINEFEDNGKGNDLSIEFTANNSRDPNINGLYFGSYRIE